MIKVKKVTYTPADIFAMFETPQEVLAAPSEGKVNNVLGISHFMDFQTESYTGGDALQYFTKTRANGAVYQEGLILTRASDYNKPAAKGVDHQETFTTEFALLVTTNALCATGNSDISVYIIYEEKDIV